MIPFRRKMEKTLSIPEQIVRDADLEAGEKSFEEQIDKWGLRLLGPNEEIKRR